MAFLIPENLASRSDVPERFRIVAAALREQLPDDVTVWLEHFSLDAQLAPPRSLRGQGESSVPFLAIVLPRHGLLWLDVLAGGSRALEQQRGRRTKGNPVPAAIGRLEEHSRPVFGRLAESGDSRTRGIPVLTACAAPMVPARAAPPGSDRKRVLFADDIVGLEDAIAGLFERARRESTPLTSNEQDVLRAALHPECVIRDDRTRQEQGRLALRQRNSPDDEQTIKLLDREQERLAKDLGSGYRVIKGVAGSGKTLVLVFRAKFVRSDLRVLLTCFNRVLADQLENQLSNRTNVTVRNIDRLPYELDRRAHDRGIPFSLSKDGTDFDLRITESLDLLTRHPELGLFDIVLVDEAQDFDPQRLEFAYRLLKPEKTDFVVARDAAQNVYRRPDWIPPETSGRGRTKILKRNYRNTREILYLAWEVLRAGDQSSVQGDPEIDDVIIEPEAALRRGPLPETLSVREEDEQREVSNRIQRAADEGARWDDIAVLCGNRKTQRRYADELERRSIPHLNTADTRERNRVASTRNHVLIASLRHLKGLEFPYVFLGGISEIAVGGEEADDVTERRALYVAMTRATRHLTVVLSGDSAYADDIQRWIHRWRHDQSNYDLIDPSEDKPGQPPVTSHTTDRT